MAIRSKTRPQTGTSWFSGKTYPGTGPGTRGWRRGVYLRGVMGRPNTIGKSRGDKAAYSAGRRRADQHATAMGRTGKNIGSFKGRAGSWKKGTGGRFVGSA